MSKSLILIWWCSICFLFAGCTSSTTKLEDITKFSTNNKGDYLLFHLMDPLGNEGYISEVKSSGDIVSNYLISDKHFSPSDIFQYNKNFFFVNGAYSNDTKVMKYNPLNQKFSLIDTNQEQFIEKYYNDEKSEYIITTLDKDSKNNICDIKNKKCINFPDEYTHDVTVLDDYIIVVSIIEQKANQDYEINIKKLNKDLELIEEKKVNNLPNYFTYTSPDQKLYLFMIDGNIIEIDSDLEISTYSTDLSNISKGILRVNYNKNVMIDKNKILVNIEILKQEEKINFLAEITFKNKNVQMNIIENSENESILNIDSESNEIYTRSYIDGKTVINIRDIKTLKVKNKLNLENEDAIYFVDNIK